MFNYSYIVYFCMKKIFKEISLLVILPLILMSVSLAAVGPDHHIKTLNVPRIAKLREFSDVPIACNGNLYNDIKIMEHALIEFEKTLSV